MTKTVFRDTAGNTYENPNPEMLQDLIFNAGDEFWAGGNGEAALYFYENDRRKSKLLLTGLEDYGFMLHQAYDSSSEDELVLVEGEHPGETVEVVIGGEPIPCRSEYFVSKETAWQVVDYFLQTGKRNGFNWQPHEMPELVGEMQAA